uniref:MazG family protein n=1 Tax=Vaginimicrobium propionicum TaxID=1871034 RepID=UPI000970C4A6|nr:MazG family protein [Vaginimicrobium propionicum]
MSQLERLSKIMHRLRRECPWDAKQTHRSLVKHLIEETAETVDAIEEGDDEHLVEELGDVLLQVFFHAEIASQERRFDIEDVARAICDKLVHRHPWVFEGQLPPSDVYQAWEARKDADKKRTSCLDGIPVAMPALARANKVVYRARSKGVDVELADDEISGDVGEKILDLVERAQASGIDAEQSLRDALRSLEKRIRQAEGVDDMNRPAR